MIQELVEKAGLRIKEGNVIDLGYENGWIYSEKITNLYNILREYKVEGSGESETIGNCLTEYRFKVKSGSELYTVVSKVDSGD